jgi:hypothetical protein
MASDGFCCVKTHNSNRSQDSLSRPIVVQIGANDLSRRRLSSLKPMPTDSTVKKCQAIAVEKSE